MSRWILVGRLTLLGFGAWAIWIAFFPMWGSAVARDALYTCPMHPDVRSGTAGDCSICGMALELVAAERVGPAASPEIMASPLGRNSVKPAVRHVFSGPIEAPAWVDEQRQIRALLYNDEVDAVSAGDQPLAAFDTAGSAPLRVSRTPESPAPWDEATALVTFRVEAALARELAPGSVGRLLLERRRRSTLVIPDMALLARDGELYVLVRSSDGKAFEKRPVTPGKTQYGMVTVIAGLEAHAPVVMRNAFLLDAERRSRSAPLGMP